MLLPADGGHGVPEGLMFPLVVLPEFDDPGVPADELDVPALPGVPQLPDVPLGGFVPLGVDVVLPGAPGVTLFGEPGVVLFGLLGLGLVVLGVVVLGVVVLGVVLLPGVLCVVPGVLWVVPGVVELCGVVVLVVPGDVVDPVPAGAVVEPGVELCPAVPVVPPAGAVPPAGELCATTQLPQHRITDSNVSFVIDIFLPPITDRLLAGIAFFPSTAASIGSLRGTCYPANTLVLEQILSGQSGVFPSGAIQAEQHGQDKLTMSARSCQRGWCSSSFRACQ